MKYLVILSLLSLSQVALADDTQQAAQQLNKNFAEHVLTGKSDIGNLNCRLVYGSLLDQNPTQIEYARAQLNVVGDKNVVLQQGDFEVFFDGNQKLDVDLDPAKNYVFIRSGKNVLISQRSQDILTVMILSANPQKLTSCFFELKK